MLFVIMALVYSKLDYGGSCVPYPLNDVNANGPTILGLPTRTNLNFVMSSISASQTLNRLRSQVFCVDLSATNIQLIKQLFKQYKDCFKRVGCFRGEYHITADSAIPLVVRPLRRRPEALKDLQLKMIFFLVMRLKLHFVVFIVILFILHHSDILYISL